MRILPVGNVRHVCVLSLLVFSQLSGQDTNHKKEQINRIRQLEKAGALPELGGFLKDPERPVRIEAVKAIVRIGSQASLEPLIVATRDADGEVRVRATEGIVEVYLPGYLTENSLSGYIARGMRQIKGFFSARNDSIIDDDVKVREDVSRAITEEIGFGDEMPPRSNAALAAGVLRLKAAVPALVQALRAKDNDLIFESLVALQKIHDPSAGPGVGFLVRDLDERTQLTALETVGVLRSTQSAPDVRYALENARNLKVSRAALSAMAMLGQPEDRTVFKKYLGSGDMELRIAALEGLGRMREPEDTPALRASYDEANADWRIHLAAAFALVNEGDTSTKEFSPLLYLIENLKSGARSGRADTYLRELIHREDVRKGIVPALPEATRAQKLALCWIFASSESDDLIPALNQLATGGDAQVATAAGRALHVLQTRRPS